MRDKNYKIVKRGAQWVRSNNNSPVYTYSIYKKKKFLWLFYRWDYKDTSFSMEEAAAWVHNNKVISEIVNEEFYL